MSLQILPVTTSQHLKEFIFLPEKIRDDRPNWVPPVWMDEKMFHNERKNPVYKSVDTERWLAIDDGKIVGRIMGIIHKEYNKLHNEKTARFFAFHCRKDKHVSKALLDEVQNWARSKAMNRLIGPFGFSDKDPQGLQVEGFEHMPVIATATNPPYVQQMVEEHGFHKLVDCIVYRLDLPDKTPEIYHRIAERVLRNTSLQSINFKSRFQLKPFIIPTLRLVNETYKEIFGFMPMSEIEMKKLASQYLPLLNPRFVKMIIDHNRQPIAFVIASPDFSEGLQKAKGRLFPFGFIELFRSMKRTEQLDLLLGAVRPDFQGRGLTSVLGLELFKEAKNSKLKFIDSHLILETNLRMRAELERLGGMIYKRYRIYQKQI